MDLGFYLKKLITFFVEPSGIILTLVILGLYFLYRDRYKKAKIFLSLGFGFFFLFAYPPISYFLLHNLETTYPKYSYKYDIKYIHVLGAGHTTNVKLSLSSQTNAIRRTIEGIIIHNRIKDSKLIFTGFKGDTNTSNAQMNANLAMALGVKEKDIIIGDKPKDTYEEALFIKSLLSKESFVLVSSATHLQRAMNIFHSLGLHPIPAPTSIKSVEFKGFLQKPTLGTFYKSHEAIHEYYGIVWCYAKTFIGL